MAILFPAPYLALLLCVFLPSRLLGRAALIVGAGALAAIFGVTLASLLGPNSDTSMHVSNWDSHQAHGLFVAILASEAALAGFFAWLALNSQAPAGVIRALFAGTWLFVACATYIVLVGLSN